MRPDARRSGARREEALKGAPRATDDHDWGATAKRRHLAFRLALLADLDNDADAFIIAIHAGGMESTHALHVARRLLAANRPAEALDWLDKPGRRVEDEGNARADTDLRIGALEALGRRDEAQSIRWRHFERFLSAEHLSAYLNRMPDFDDFEAEQKALERCGGTQAGYTGVGVFYRMAGHSIAPTAWCVNGWWCSTAASMQCYGRRRKPWRKGSRERRASSTAA